MKAGKTTHRSIICMMLLLTVSVFAETGMTFNAADKEILASLKSLNDYRARTGLKPVKLNVELSKACFNHSRYVVKNYGHPATKGLSGHYEIDSLPYATKDGKKAGLSSCIAYTRPEYAMQQFMNTFYHRMPLIDPNCTEVGIGFYTEGGYTVCCVDMRNGRSWNNDTATSVVVFPEDGAYGIPLEFQNEMPNPIPAGIYSPGYPITIQFFKQWGVKNVQVKLTTQTGKVIDCLLSTPENPLTSFPQYNIVCIIPKDELDYNNTYTIDFACTLAGKPFRKKWSFSTELYLGNN